MDSLCLTSTNIRTKHLHGGQLDACFEGLSWACLGQEQERSSLPADYQTLYSSQMHFSPSFTPFSTFSC